MGAVTVRVARVSKAVSVDRVTVEHASGDAVDGGESDQRCAGASTVSVLVAGEVLVLAVLPFGYAGWGTRRIAAASVLSTISWWRIGSLRWCLSRI